MSSIPEVAIGAIVAAIIAAVVALLGLIISKEQKVSDFRQAWIDALRADIAQLIANANAVHGASVTPNQAGSDPWARVSKHFLALNQTTAAIRLRLNPKEKPSKAVLDKIDELEDVFASRQRLDHIELNNLEKELVSLAKAVLKEEWTRVQRGEMVFRLAKYLAGLMVVALMGVGVYVLICGNITPSNHAVRDKSNSEVTTRRILN